MFAILSQVTLGCCIVVLVNRLLSDHYATSGGCEVT